MTFKLPEPVAWQFFYGDHGWPTFNSVQYAREYSVDTNKGDALHTRAQLIQALRDWSEDTVEDIELVALDTGCGEEVIAETCNKLAAAIREKAKELL